MIEQVKLKAVETVQSFRLDMWLARQTPAKVLPLLHKVLTGVREEFADALAYGGGVYAAGYCFGAKYVLLLGAGAPTDPAAVGETTTGEGNEDPAAAAAKGGDEAPTTAIKAGALAHGTMITREDLQGMAAPVSMVCVDDDQLFPDEVREAGAQALQTNGVKHEVRMYSGMPHGEWDGKMGTSMVCGLTASRLRGSGRVRGLEDPGKAEAGVHADAGVAADTLAAMGC